MTVTNIDSSNIKTLEFNEAIETLVVEFHSGSKYAYAKVPKAVFAYLITAPSIGRAFSNIRNNYTYVRLV